MSFGNPQIISTSASQVIPRPPRSVPGPNQPTRYGATTISVTKEAPVNALHPDFAGGALGDGSVANEDVALNAAIAFAKTASRSGGMGELFIPAGYYKTSARLQLGDCSTLRVFSEGNQTAIIEQQTDNEPIIESQASAGVQGLQLEGLFLRYLNQQTSLMPNSSAIRLLNPISSGFWLGLYEGLRIDKANIGLEWGPSGVQTGVGFWNNTMRRIDMNDIGSNLIKNSNTAAIGGPTNFVDRLTYQSPNHIIPNIGTATSYALYHGGGHKFEYTSLDIEDWYDGLLYVAGNGGVTIKGLHLERYHLWFNNGGGTVFYINSSPFAIENFDGIFYRDGTGAYTLFNINTGARADIGPMQLNTHVPPDPNPPNPSTASGIIRIFAGDGTASQFKTGPRRILDAANIVDIAITDGNYATTLESWISDNGLPPIWDSSVALPAASATYRGRTFFVKGTNAATADTIQSCMQSAAGTFSWKVVATG